MKHKSALFRPIMSCLLMIWVSSLCRSGLMAQTFQVDLNQLDTKSYAISGPGLNSSGPNTGQMSFSVTGAGTCVLELSALEGTSAYVQFDVTATGVISNLSWKDGDGSQTGGQYVALPATQYMLSAGNKTLKLTGNTIVLDMLALDYDTVMVPQLDMPGPSTWNGGTNGNGSPQGGPAGGEYQLKLFPGDYNLQFPSGQCEVQMEITDQGVPGDSPRFRDSGGSWELFHSDYYSVNGNEFLVSGMTYTIDLQDADSQNVAVNWVIPQEKDVLSGTSKSFQMIPGTYSMELSDVTSGAPEAKLLINIGNGNTEIGPDPKILEAVPGPAWGPPYDLEPGEIYLERHKVVIQQPLPKAADNNPNLGPRVYAELHRELDGGYYVLDTRWLAFRYQEPYEAPGNLEYSIKTLTNQDVTPAVNLPKEYGMNWLSIDLSQHGFVQNGTYYILSVFDSKGAEYKLKFRY